MIDPSSFDSPTTSLPVADIKAIIEGENIIQQHNYPVIPSIDDQSDFMISIRANNLRKWRAKLNEISDMRFPWAEILLAVAAIIGGASLSAVISGVKVDTTIGTWVYIVLPPIGVASFVSQIFIRLSSTSKPKHIAKDLLTEIPDPQTSTKQGRAK